MGDDKKEEQKQVYFLDRGAHAEHLKMASEDIIMIRSHLNHHTSDDVNPPLGLVSDLCEYYSTLESFIKLLIEIKSLPIVPSAENDGEDYVLGGEEALLLKFYLPILVQLEDKARRHNLSLAYH
tara:strand:+ start:1690 stop:2061 length:372 start_codon:yes stop_codon:yes gene_type:complete